jgi:hypothetical protein
MTKDGTARRQVAGQWGKHDHTVLVLQGGGALGAYQAGAFEEIASAGLEPDWVTGVSIGAINSALIAGNPPERRVERLREFWDRATSQAPFIPPSWLDALRPLFNGRILGERSLQMFAGAGDGGEHTVDAVHVGVACDGRLGGDRLLVAVGQHGPPTDVLGGGETAFPGTGVVNRLQRFARALPPSPSPADRTGR